MLEFHAYYFDGKSSRAHEVLVCFDGVTFDIQNEAISRQVALAHSSIQPPLGKTRRTIKLPGNTQLETDDHLAMNALEQSTKINQGMRLVNWLEGRWGWVLGCFAGLLIFVFAFIKFGLPFIAKEVAYATPISVMDAVSERTLLVLDDNYFSASQLSEKRQKELSEHFQNVTDSIGGDYSYRLEFRHGSELGANALALPSGIIIITDELVELSEDDSEIIGVLAHEIGHVTGRHGLRSIYQSAGVFLMVSLLTGDFASATSLGTALPAVLLQSGYSRDFEREADKVAGEYLLAQFGDTAALQDMLSRLSEEHGESDLSFLESHPGTDERIENLEGLEGR